ncbi:unnamed protein product [Cladocopium goreaui]|uniref:RING-type domain-containing protein n=1 Tax=Cladocopium goreaui TaxID=2562237 RepID=A0A9P1D0K0_9DINO|nr:unnamed protein product [Cladocopium goreaui]
MGRDHKRARTQPREQMMLNPMMMNPAMMMNPMLAGMGSMMQPPPQRGQAQAEESSSSDEGQGQSAPASSAAPTIPKTGGEAVVPPVTLLMALPVNCEKTWGRSVSMLRQVPRNRLAMCLNSICLDPTATSNLSIVGLLGLLWLWCRLRPNLRVCDLGHLDLHGCETYQELAEKFMTAHLRVRKSMTDARFQDEIMSRLPLDMGDSDVLMIAGAFGWSSEFMAKATSKRSLAKAAVKSSGHIGNLLAKAAPPPPKALATTMIPAAVFATSPKAVSPPKAPPPAVPAAASTPPPRASVVYPKATSSPPKASPPRLSLGQAMDAAAESASGPESNEVAGGSAVEGESGEGGAAAEPPAAGVVAGPVCAICHEVMLQSEDGETLPCPRPHTFHARCLNEWREVTGVPNHHCPYRCHESNQNVEQAGVTTAAENGVSDEAGDSAGDVAEEPVAFM